MSEVTPGPRSSVFTTMRFSRNGGIFLLREHLDRIQSHADKLRIDAKSIDLNSILDVLQTYPPELDEGLVRIELTKSLEFNVVYRPFSIQNEIVDAVALASPIWPKRIAGTKHGAWDAYIDARQQAETRGADLALLVHEYCIVDADRCTPLILDEDGVVWVSDSDLAVQSITFEALKSHLINAGYHIQRGNLNERLVARCAEAVAVGSGVGVVGIDSVDGEDIGHERSPLFEFCKSILEQQYGEPNNWTEVWK